MHVTGMCYGHSPGPSRNRASAPEGRNGGSLAGRGQPAKSVVTGEGQLARMFGRKVGSTGSGEVKPGGERFLAVRLARGGAAGAILGFGEGGGRIIAGEGLCVAGGRALGGFGRGR